MLDMNNFIQSNREKLKNFIDRISSRDGKDEEPTKVDLGLEIELLKEHFKKNKAKLLTPDCPLSISAVYELVENLENETDNCKKQEQGLPVSPRKLEDSTQKEPSPRKIEDFIPTKGEEASSPRKLEDTNNKREEGEPAKPDYFFM